MTRQAFIGTVFALTVMPATLAADPVVTERTDAITDEPFVRAELPADDPRVTLIVQCERNRTSVGIAGVKALYSFFVDHRIDKNPPKRRQRWSRGNDFLGYQSGSEAVPFIRQLLHGKSLLVRVQPNTGSERDYRFDLTGLEEPINKIAAACNWKIDGPTQISSPKDSSFAKAIEDALASPSPPQNRPPPITQDEFERVQKQIQKCWFIPSDARSRREAVVEIAAIIGEDGTVADARVIDKARMENDEAYRLLAESARKALLNPICNPLPLPREKFAQWRKTTFTFNPNEP